MIFSLAFSIGPKRRRAEIERGGGVLQVHPPPHPPAFYLRLLVVSDWEICVGSTETATKNGPMIALYHLVEKVLNRVKDSRK